MRYQPGVPSQFAIDHTLRMGGGSVHDDVERSGDEIPPTGYTGTHLAGVAMPTELWEQLSDPEHASLAAAGVSHLEEVRSIKGDM